MFRRWAFPLAVPPLDRNSGRLLCPNSRQGVVRAIARTIGFELLAFHLNELSDVVRHLHPPGCYATELSRA